MYTIHKYRQYAITCTNEIYDKVHQAVGVNLWLTRGSNTSHERQLHYQGKTSPSFVLFLCIIFGQCNKTIFILLDSMSYNIKAVRRLVADKGEQYISPEAASLPGRKHIPPPLSYSYVSYLVNATKLFLFFF